MPAHAAEAGGREGTWSLHIQAAPALEALWSPLWVQGQAFRCCDTMPVTPVWVRAWGCRPCLLPPPRPAGLVCIGQGGWPVGRCHQGVELCPTRPTRGVTRRCRGPRGCRGAGPARSRAAAATSQGGGLPDSRLVGWVCAHRSLCPEASGAGAGPAPAPGSCWGPWASPTGQALPDLLGSDRDLGEDILSGWPPLPSAGPPVRSGSREEALASHPQRGPAGGWVLGSQESEEPLAGRGEVGAGIRDSQVQGPHPDALISCGLRVSLACV